jgi:hypothetical protein
MTHTPQQRKNPPKKKSCWQQIEIPTVNDAHTRTRTRPVKGKVMWAPSSKKARIHLILEVNPLHNRRPNPELTARICFARLATGMHVPSQTSLSFTLELILSLFRHWPSLKRTRMEQNSGPSLFTFFYFIFTFSNNNQYQNIFTFFTFYIISIIFYYYSNKKIHYNTKLFHFSIQIFFTLYYIITFY